MNYGFGRNYTLEIVTRSHFSEEFAAEIPAARAASLARAGFRP
jgi:hypothetical protein